MERKLSKNSRLNCCFINFKKAFDSIYRNALWYKLFNFGLDGKLIRIFRDMYSSVSSCVKLCNTLSDFFDILIGLRQGQNNSPILFALFLEDLEQYLIHYDNNNNDKGFIFYDICTIILPFADDEVIFGKSVEEL
jgi:hypothetical protein